MDRKSYSAIFFFLLLRERVLLGPEQRFRLVGVGLSNFLEPEDLSAQAGLFD
jgi:hypothetical protein